jgi:lysozyme family protein
MTDDEVGRFIFEYYKNIRGSELPNSVAVAMTEAAWGSGQGRAFKHLRDSLSDLGRPVISNSQAIQAAAQVPEKRLFDAYFNQRLNYLANTLGSQPKYGMFRRGWINRQNAFKALFTGVPILLPLFFLGILAAGIIKNS